LPKDQLLRQRQGLTLINLSILWAKEKTHFNQQLSDFRGPGSSSHQADGKVADTLEDSDDGNVKASDNGCNAGNDFDSDIPQADAHFYSLMVLFSPLKLLTIHFLYSHMRAAMRMTIKMRTNRRIEKSEQLI
jgi:hypothetical protein